MFDVTIIPSALQVILLGLDSFIIKQSMLGNCVLTWPHFLLIPGAKIKALNILPDWNIGFKNNWPRLEALDLAKLLTRTSSNQNFITSQDLRNQCLSLTPGSLFLLNRRGGVGPEFQGCFNCWRTENQCENRTETWNHSEPGVPEVS